MNQPVLVASPDHRMQPREWSKALAMMGNARTSVPENFWNVFAAGIAGAEVFDFGLVDDIKLRSEAVRGGELWAPEHLRLPYPAVVYWYTLQPDPLIVAAEGIDYRLIRFCSLAMRSPGIKTCVGDDLVQPTLVADFIVIPPNVATMPPGTRSAYEMAVGVVFGASRSISGKWAGELFDAQNFQAAIATGMLGSAADGIVGLSMILATRGVPVRAEQAPTKLNAKRAKHGRPPLTRVTHIDTKAYYEALANTERAGTHASPVPHLRRGHIRHLSSGKTTWIRDALINCRSVAELRERTRYEVET